MKQALNDLDPLIKRAAKLVAYKWPGVVEAGDMAQDLHLHLLERPNQVDTLRRMESDKSRYNILIKIGHRIAAKERKEYAYFQGTYRYSVNEVKAILKAGALRWLESDPDVQKPMDDELGFLRFLSDNSFRFINLPVQSAITDVRMAMDLLVKRHPPYAEAVTRRYLYEETPQTTKDKNALTNGIVALVEEMNRVARTNYATRDDGLGTRKCISNARAQAITHHDWRGENLDYEGIRWQT